jgi:broad specificity phosphatase PhoE
MKRRRFLALAVLATVGLATRARAQAPIATTVIVVRHAEKAAEPAGNPPLTATGKVRAKALARALKDAGVTAVITTEYLRTRETAAPTAEEFHLTPDVVAVGRGTVADHAAAVARAVMLHAGGTVLVVDHSNIVPAIVAALGAPRPAEICDAEYDRMEIVTVQWGGKATAVRARYGAATPVGKHCSAMTEP